MKRENIDYVKYDPKVDTAIDFIVAGKARKASEEFEEILKITKKIFDITAGFYIPTKIGYRLFSYNEDIPIDDLLVHNQFYHTITKPIDNVPGIINDSNGITYTQLVNNIREAKTNGKIKSIWGIYFYEGKTKFVLNSVEQFVDKHTQDKYTLYNHDQVIVIPNKEDPILLEITQSINKGNERVNSNDPAFYNIGLSTYTDIWFSDNDIGFANRERLKAIIKKIHDDFDVVYTLFTSDLYDGDWLRDIIPNLNI